MQGSWPLFARVSRRPPVGPIAGFRPTSGLGSTDGAIPEVVRHAAIRLADLSPYLNARRFLPVRAAICVGSRGLAGLGLILEQLCGLLATRGITPLIVPAMGSHGKATIAGQIEVLRRLGVFRAVPGVPLGVALGEPPAVRLGRTPRGLEVWCAPAALRVDAVILVNRVKPHTAFNGQVQSGLVKMLAVGLGGPCGAREVHRRGPGAMEGAILELARTLAGRVPLAGGLAGVEDETGGLALVRSCGGTWSEIRETDGECLSVARSLEPSLPVDDVDLLMVDYMGKDICGTGLHPGVIGRRRAWDYPEPEGPRVKRLVVFRLTAASGGNANGIGLADFTTKRLAADIDWETTLRNAETTTLTQRVCLPPVLADDRAAVALALKSLGLEDWTQVRAIRLRDTGNLGTYLVSPALGRETGVTEGPWRPLPFGPGGDLTDLEDGRR